ncbi:methyltransferase domain-containing protein [Halobacillus sp. Marseille-Q1614]|uniref:methyltransferase domain-containing protein n=1 Tax=Halobacillus sp. Marseille-Q1614 TaxID=2709134 RepID=UPI001570F33D|nr:methyltransferase domain-containing protein [Halobacillus sp. Marseille-Q1614]
MSRLKQKLDIDKIVFIGRTYEEYMDMFALSEEFVRRIRILDCPAGACSFTAVGRKKGFEITSCDIVYDHSVEDLRNKGLEDIDHAMEHMEKAKNNYVWDYFKDIDELREYRASALKDCTDDMREHGQTYVPVTLPALPFKDESFDILLSAHFLFMYADRLDYDFHEETLKELLRVSKEEIRIFPLVDLEGNKYKHLDKLKKFIMSRGCRVEELKVPYEFQDGADSMLKITKVE